MTNLLDILPDNLKSGLTPAEERVLKEAPWGKPIDFRTGDKEQDDPANADSWDETRTIHAKFLEWLCTDPSATAHVHRTGLTIHGVRVASLLDLECATLPWRLRVLHSAVTAGVNLQDAVCHTLAFSGSHVGSITADGLTVKGSLFFSGVKAKGEVRLLGADIGGQLSCTGAIFDHPRAAEEKDASAFNADRLTVKGDLFLHDVQAKGEVRLLGADIGGNLECDRAVFVHPRAAEDKEAKAFSADGLTVKGSLFLRGVQAKGEVRLLGADIGGQLSCTGAIFDHPRAAEEKDASAFTADKLTVKGDLFLRDVQAKGEVRLLGADVGGQLDCNDAAFAHPLGDAFCAEKLNVHGPLVWRPKNISGLVVLGAAHVAELLDIEKSWPQKGHLILDGFEYDKFAGNDTPRTARERLEWLHRQPDKPFRPQPYEQLAKVFRNMGHEHEARKVLVAKEDDRYIYGNLSWSARLANRFWWFTLGHGYRIWPITLLFFIMPLVGWCVFSWARAHKVMLPSNDIVLIDTMYVAQGILPEEYPCLQPLAYSIDAFLPVVNLHQEDYWLPDSHMPDSSVLTNVRLTWGPWSHFFLPALLWCPSGPIYPWGWWIRGYLWFHITMGWILVSLLATYLSGKVRKE